MQDAPQPNTHSPENMQQLGMRFWALVVLTGIGAGLGGAALMALLRVVQHLAYAYHTGNFLNGVEHTADSRRLLMLFAAGVIAGVARPLLRRVLGPGEGLSAAVWLRQGQFAPPRAIVEGVISIVIVGMGASLGREAAPKEAGAAVGSALARWAHLTPEQQRLLVACGAGAGMGAVYNVPFGGALFAVEVLLGTLSLPLVLPALATALIATAVSWIYLPMAPTYSVPSYAVSLTLIGWAIVAGPLLGLAAAAFVRLIALANARTPTGWRVVPAPIVVFTALGFLSFAYPQVLGNGKDIVQPAFVGGFTVPLLVALLFLKPLATACCQGSGAHGGLFTPVMTVGAVLGELLGMGWMRLWPGAPLGSYAVIGSGAVLAAATQGPISSVVLLLELTHHVDALMVPLLLCVVEASLVARAIEPRSIYSARV